MKTKKKNWKERQTDTNKLNELRKKETKKKRRIKETKKRRKEEGKK